MIRDLTSLLHPCPEETFLDHFARKERLLVRTQDADRAVTLFPWPEIERLIADDIVPAALYAVLRDGANVPTEMYRRRDGEGRLRVAALRALLAQGASVNIDDLPRFVPQVARLTSAIERRLACKVQCNTYLSFTKGGAFANHFDLHDVIVLQVHGRKCWRTYGMVDRAPIEGKKLSRTTAVPQWETILEPGDLLYLPRGEIHAATLDGPYSVHLTIGITAPRGLDYLSWIQDKAAELLLFRQDLPVTSGAAAIGQREAEIAAALAKLMKENSLSAFLADGDRRRLPLPFLDLGMSSALEADTIVVPALRRAVPLSLDDDNTVDVTIGGDIYSLSRAERQILALACASGNPTVSELAQGLAGQLTGEAVEEVLRSLVRQGLVGLLAAR